jgi:hypothetical protein
VKLCQLLIDLGELTTQNRDRRGALVSGDSTMSAPLGEKSGPLTINHSRRPCFLCTLGVGDQLIMLEL